MSDELQYAYEREEMETSQELVGRVAFLEEIVEADLLEAMIHLWRHSLHSERAKDSGANLPMFHEGQFWGLQKHAAELAIQDLFRFFHMGICNETQILNAKIEGREKGRKAEQELADKVDFQDQMLNSVRAENEDTKNRARQQFDRLEKLLDVVIRQDVTHAERRGQLKLFIDAMHDALRTILDDLSDIPF